jgi:hypothetical protein
MLSDFDMYLIAESMFMLLIGIFFITLSLITDVVCKYILLDHFLYRTRLLSVTDRCIGVGLLLIMIPIELFFNQLMIHYW